MNSNQELTDQINKLEQNAKAIFEQIEFIKESIRPSKTRIMDYEIVSQDQTKITIKTKLTITENNQDLVELSLPENAVLCLKESTQKPLKIYKPKRLTKKSVPSLVNRYNKFPLHSQIDTECTWDGREIKYDIFNNSVPEKNSVQELASVLDVQNHNNHDRKDPGWLEGSEWQVKTRGNGFARIRKFDGKYIALVGTSLSESTAAHFSTEKGKNKTRNTLMLNSKDNVLIKNVPISSLSTLLSAVGGDSRSWEDYRKKFCPLDVPINNINQTITETKKVQSQNNSFTWNKIDLSKCWTAVEALANRRYKADNSLPLENQITGAAAEIGFEEIMKTLGANVESTEEEKSERDFIVNGKNVDVKGFAGRHLLLKQDQVLNRISKTPTIPFVSVKIGTDKTATIIGWIEPEDVKNKCGDPKVFPKGSGRPLWIVKNDCYKDNGELLNACRIKI